MKKNIECFINGEKHIIAPGNSFISLAKYLRYIKGLTGTKIVCSEGDCGACTVLVSQYKDGEMGEYEVLNSCIRSMFLMHRTHIISVEGIQGAPDGNNRTLDTRGLHEVQKQIVEAHGTQCGYCTPGFVCAMVGMSLELKKNCKNKTSKKIKNYLTGNLCRCTGYDSLIKAAKKIDLEKVLSLGDIYNDQGIASYFLNLPPAPLKIQYESKEVFIPHKIEELLAYKKENADAIFLAGGTDLGVAIEKKSVILQKMIVLGHVEGLSRTRHLKERIEISSMATLAKLERELENDFPDFSKMIHIFASPQIKTVATLMGNLLNASPIGDTLGFLLLVEAKIELVYEGGSRLLEISDFIKEGYKKLDIKPFEFASKIILPKTRDQFRIYKVSKRRDLDISTISMCARFNIVEGKILSFSLAFGGVAPRILKLEDTANLAVGKTWERKLFVDMGALLEKEISPFSDHRGSREFRVRLCKNLLLKLCADITEKL